MHPLEPTWPHGAGYDSEEVYTPRTTPQFRAQEPKPSTPKPQGKQPRRGAREDLRPELKTPRSGVWDSTLKRKLVEAQKIRLSRRTVGMVSASLDRRVNAPGAHQIPLGPLGGEGHCRDEA